MTPQRRSLLFADQRRGLFDGLAVAMEWLIDAILWVLQTQTSAVHHRPSSARLTMGDTAQLENPLLIVWGFLFIPQSGLWEKRPKA